MTKMAHGIGAATAMVQTSFCLASRVILENGDFEYVSDSA